MTAKTYRSLFVASLQMICVVGPGFAQTQANVSVQIDPKTSPSAVVQVIPQPGYATQSEVHSATGGHARLAPTQPGHEGKGEIDYRKETTRDGGRVHWDARTHETSKNGAAPSLFPPVPQYFTPPPPPGFPPPLKMEFPVPPGFGQMPSGFQMSPPPGFPTPPPMPFPVPFVAPFPPQFPAGAHTISSSTGEGDIEYYQRDNGSGTSWSSKSSSSFQSTWPPKAGTNGSSPKEKGHGK